MRNRMLCYFCIPLLVHLQTNFTSVSEVESSATDLRSLTSVASLLTPNDIDLAASVIVIVETAVIIDPTVRISNVASQTNQVGKVTG